MNLQLPDVVGNDPGQGTHASSGIAEGLCSWLMVSTEQAVRNEVRRSLGQFSQLCGHRVAPRGGTLLDTGHALECKLVVPHTCWN